MIKDYDYFIFNEDVKIFVKEIEGIILFEKNKVSRYKNIIIEKFKEEL